MNLKPGLKFRIKPSLSLEDLRDIGVGPRSYQLLLDNNERGFKILSTSVSRTTGKTLVYFYRDADREYAQMRNYVYNNMIILDKSDRTHNHPLTDMFASDKIKKLKD